MSQSRHPQQPLALGAASSYTFENFHVGDNQLPLQLLRNLALDGERQIYLWAGHNCGKTHLLNACHSAALSAQRRSFYVSLDGAVAADICDSLDGFDVVCLDNLDGVAGDQSWERALFTLINDCRASGTQLVLAASTPPAAGGWQLPDLVSRLSWGPVVQLQRLREEACLTALVEGAAARGMQFDVGAARYLMQRHSRDVGVLLGLIPLFDRETLAAGRRRITIPFLRRCLALD